MAVSTVIGHYLSQTQSFTWPLTTNCIFLCFLQCKTSQFCHSTVQLSSFFGSTGSWKQDRTSPSADMVRLNVNVQFQVKPLSTGASSSRTKFFFSKMLVWTPSRCVPSLESLAQVLVKHQISSQTIKYSYKFKSNPIFFLSKIFLWTPQGAYQVWSF